MSVGSQRERNRTEQRDRILDAARSLFSTHGPEEVTMAEVADRAGVARATVFNYFPTKHGLVEAITEEVFAYYAGMLEAALADAKTPTASLVLALFEQMGTGVEAFHGFYRGIFREMAKIQLGLDEGGPSQRARGRANLLLVDLFSRGRERGELDPSHDPRALASAFEALVNGTIVHWLYDDSSESLRDRMRRASRIFLSPVATNLRAMAARPLPVLVPPEASSTPRPRVRKPRR